MPPCCATPADARAYSLGTIDALIAQLCIEHDLALLTADKDFTHAARFVPLRLAISS